MSTSSTVIDDDRQLLFARLSGDHNPLHVDAVHARRTQFGRPVVHGVHLVLRALEALDIGEGFGLRRLTVQFRGSVLVGDAFEVTVTSPDGNEHHIDVSVGGELRARMLVVPDPGNQIPTTMREWPVAPAMMRDIADLDGLAGVEGDGHDLALFAALFPSLATSFSPADATVLLALTRIIGMRCPGRSALFRGFSFELLNERDGPDRGGVVYEVGRVNERLSMLDLVVRAGPRSITASVMVRAAPPAQLSLADVGAEIEQNESAGVRALIVGGSRGLGELAAKIIVAGGGSVLLTYRSGEREAAELTEILGARASSLHLDVTSQTSHTLSAVDDFEPTHLFFFATPPITKRAKGSWDPNVFDDFVACYVVGLSRLLASVVGLDGVFYPSSVFVDDRPNGFAEYVAAKEMGEVLCRTWAELHPETRVTVRRLPPLLTDQTAGRPGQRVEANLEVLLPIVRAVVERVS